MARRRGYFNPRDQGLYLHVILKHFPCFGGVQKSRQTGSTLHMMVRPCSSSAAPPPSVPKTALVQLPAGNSSLFSFVQMTSELDFSLPDQWCGCTSNYGSRSGGRRDLAAPRQSCSEQGVAFVGRYNQSLRPWRG